MLDLGLLWVEPQEPPPPPPPDDLLLELPLDTPDEKPEVDFVEALGVLAFDCVGATDCVGDCVDLLDLELLDLELLEDFLELEELLELFLKVELWGTLV